MQTYFEDRKSTPLEAMLPTGFMALLCLGCLILIHQIFFGWIALGQRANIPRDDINNMEIAAIIAAALVGVAALRTTWGLYKGEKAGWSWAQWMSLLAMVFGFAICLNATLGSTSATSRVFNLRDFIIGAVILGSAAIIYAIVTRNADNSPHRFLSIQLAESPSAGAIVGFIFIFMVFSMASDLFLEPSSIASILTNNATKGIIAIGITMLMISGEFDLSVGSVLGVTSMIFMILITDTAIAVTDSLREQGIATIDPQSMYVVGIAAILALMCACIMGAINGILRVVTGIPSFIVTLGTLFAFRAIALVGIGGGRILRYRDSFPDFPIIEVHRGVIIAVAFAGMLAIAYTAYRLLPTYFKSFLHRWNIQHNNGDFGTLFALVSGVWLIVAAITFGILLAWLGLVIIYHLELLDSNLAVQFFDVANGRWSFTLQEVTRQDKYVLNIPRDANFRNAIVWWAILVAIFQIILMRTPYGNAIFAVGGNVGAARAQGINVNRIKVQNFVLCSFMAGIAAILETARNPGVDPLKGDTWELDVIAMTVIGGALLTGGYGSLIGTVLGVLIFGMLQTGLVLVNVDARAFQGVIGVIMIIAVVLNNITKRSRS